jgi:hypothetical protein
MPKSGGSTAEEFLVRRFCRHRCANKESLGRFLRLQNVASYLAKSATVRARTLVHYSKASVSVWDEEGRTFVTGTMLRHPLDRIISHYRYIKYSSSPDRCSTHLPGLDDFGRWYRRFRNAPAPAPCANRSSSCERPGSMPDIANLEVRLLVTRGENEQVAHASEVSATFRSDGRRCEPIRPLPPLTEREYRFALSRLRKMSLLGIMERMDESLALWQHALKMLSLVIAQNKRVWGNSHSLRCGNALGTAASVAVSDPDLFALLERDNALSLRLYKAGEQRATRRHALRRLPRGHALLAASDRLASHRRARLRMGRPIPRCARSRRGRLLR